MLLDFGIPNDQIERSDLCSFENKALLHSYRREGQRSGRALGIIAMVNN
jgi:copper oxidase (laccase) domain-containing protein